MQVAASAAAGALVAGAGAAALAPGGATASSHREAPYTAGHPLVDNTDTYAFVSPDKPDTVTLIANVTGFQDPSGGPNFYPFGTDGYRYNIKVDNDGDAKPDATFRFTFRNIDQRGTDTFLYNNGPVRSLEDKTLLFRQIYKLERIDENGGTTVLQENGSVGPSHVGSASMPAYEDLRDQAVQQLRGGAGTAFVGQADDPFFLDIRVFDLLYGGDLSEVGQNSLNGFNVNTMALQLPTSSLTEGGDGSGIIGVWATTDQQTMTLSAGQSRPSGDFVQVSRLGAPLVNEVVFPAALKDAFNSLPPEKDRTVEAAVARVTDPEVPKLLEKLYKVPAPAAPRNDLVSAFLTGIDGVNKPPNVVPAEMLRLNTKVPPAEDPQRLGVLAKDNAGFPNGRRLTDDVVDIELQALAGAITGGIVEPLAKGDGVDSNDVDFAAQFPYVALPHSGSGSSAAGFRAEGVTPATTNDDETSGETNAASRQTDDGSDTMLIVLAAVAGLVLGAVIAGLMTRRRTPGRV